MRTGEGYISRRWVVYLPGWLSPDRHQREMPALAKAGAGESTDTATFSIVQVGSRRATGFVMSAPPHR